MMKYYQNWQRGVFGNPNLSVKQKLQDFISAWPFMAYLAAGIFAGFLDWITSPIQRRLSRNLFGIFLLCFATSLFASPESVTQDSKTGNVENSAPTNFGNGQLKVGGVAVVLPITAYQTATVSSAGNTNSTIGQPAHTLYFTANAGGGAYTATIAIPTAGRTAGDTESLHLHFAASTTPTVEIHNNTSAGTLLFTWTGDGTVTDIFAECRFDGANWFLMDAHFVW